MMKTASRITRTLIALLFVAAAGLGVSQAAAAYDAERCDTPHGLCSDDADCDDLCMIYHGTNFGGQCAESTGCCVCFD